jgi:UDP-glucose 4-epimerase
MGYIGSFTTLALIEAKYKVVVVDNLANSSNEVINRIELLTGVRPKLYNADITDEHKLDDIFAENPDIDNVIHFAALKAVGESGEIPLDYWRINVYGSLCLLRAMQRHSVNNIVFSSSATVYGDATRVPGMIPIPEHCPIAPNNVYGKTKVAVEDMITDYIKAERNNARKNGKTGAEFNAALLRYFNPGGSHPSGLMGEDPQGIPYNLLPLLAQVAAGKREKLLVFGDGTPPIQRSEADGQTTRPRTAPPSATTCTSSTSRAGTSWR